MLVTFLRKYKVNASFHIPDRFEEGYGLNTSWFTREKLNELGSEFLLITVDCGISNCHEVQWLQKRGATVVVTDHHSITEENLPDCIIVNPSMKSCGFNNEKLCGAGIAFYLAVAIRSVLASKTGKLGELSKKINLKRFLALVALGTLGDLVELTKTNRVLVRAGMEVLTGNPPLGIKELMNSCELCGSILTSEDLGFLVCPKINASGRLGDNHTAINLLIEEDRLQAAKFAKKLSSHNQERKRITREAKDYALKNINPAAVSENKIVFVSGEFHIGVVGLVASKLVEQFGVPAIVLGPAKSKGSKRVYVGSARSVQGVHIADVIEKCSKWLIKSGGHAMAAGLSILEENIQGFEKNISSITSCINYYDIVNSIVCDINCPVDILLSDSVISQYNLLEPFGPGNETTVFIDNSAQIVDARRVGGNGEHLQLIIRGKLSNYKGIGFNLGEKCSDVQKNPTKSIRYSPTVNRFRRTTSWQVRVIDIM